MNPKKLKSGKFKCYKACGSRTFVEYENFTKIEKLILNNMKFKC